MFSPRQLSACLCASVLIVALTGAAVAEKEPLPRVNITPKEYCNACMSIVELFFMKTADRAAEARKRFGADADIQGTEMMHALCKDPVWKKYKEGLGYGCLKVLHEYTAEVFGAFNGKHTLGDEEEIFRHKLTVCPNIGACKRHGMVQDTLEEHTECGACTAIAKDLEYLVDREASYKDVKRLKTVISSVCDDLGMRHTDRSKAYLEEYCDEIMEEIGLSTLAGTIKLRKSMEGGMLRLAQTLPEKMCSDLSSYCPKPKAVDAEGDADGKPVQNGDSINFEL